MSDFVGANFGTIVLGVFVALVWWSMRSVARKKDLATAGLCARCGSEAANISAPGGVGVLCEACAVRLEKEQRIGAVLFYVYALFWVVMLLLDLRDTLANGTDLRWSLWVPGVLLGVAGPLWYVRTRRVRRHGAS